VRNDFHNSVSLYVKRTEVKHPYDAVLYQNECLCVQELYTVLI